jgi:outer membrane protein OmpA-like peptidoglycan-associated protein
MRLLTGVVGMAALTAYADQTVDVGNKVPAPSQVTAGLFPNAECAKLKAAGFKCMGFKPAVRFSLPAANFQAGSSVLPALLKKQLDAFAVALSKRSPADGKVRIEGHADASGTPDMNQKLSLQRAVAAKAYLVSKGVNPDLLVAVGVGSEGLENPKDPTAAANRRVVIGRAEAQAASGN